jgi:hypothetical protein
LEAKPNFQKYSKLTSYWLWMRFIMFSIGYRLSLQRSKDALLPWNFLLWVAWRFSSFKIADHFLTPSNDIGATFIFGAYLDYWS